MDYATPAAQLAGGIAAAFLTGVLWRGLALGALGNVVVGLVGSAVAGLVASSYFGLAPAALSGGTFPAPDIAAQVGVGAAGGALLAILTGLVTSPARK